MNLAAIGQLVREFDHDYCKKTLGFFFDHEDWSNLRKLKKLYEKFSKSDNNPERKLSADESYECADMLFHAPTNYQTVMGTRYSPSRSAISYYSAEINKLKEEFKNHLALEQLAKNYLFNRENYDKVIRHSTGYDLYIAIKQLKTNGILKQTNLTKLLDSHDPQKEADMLTNKNDTFSKHSSTLFREKKLSAKTNHSSQQKKEKRYG